MNHILSVRMYSSGAVSAIQKSAKLIRNEFLDYFKKDLGHTFIRSSPVISYNDHTIAFVNAGMNQVCFKTRIIKNNYHKLLLLFVINFH